MHFLVTWVNDTEHTKVIDNQCRWEVEKGYTFHVTADFQTISMMKLPHIT